eukprot:4301024-Alexandrium_andersonii.AAC.1
MSASLVGSEMCIRDSSLPWSGAPVMHPRQLDSPAALAVLPCPGARGSSPVSYTHLTLPTICSV